MEVLSVTRRKDLRSALFPYWIILSDCSKEQFMRKYDLSGDLCKHNRAGQPVNRIDIDSLKFSGIPISNGETVNIDLKDEVTSIFVITADGSLSNEILVEEMKTLNLVVSTKGGWRTVSYPALKEQL